MGSTILPDRQSGRTQRIEIRPKMHCIISLVFLAIVLQPITVTAADQQHHQSTPHRSSESLHAHILQHVVGTAKADAQSAAAFAVIARTIGAERAAAFTITIDLKLQRNTFHLFSTEAPLSSNRSVTIVASSGINTQRLVECDYFSILDIQFSHKHPQERPPAKASTTT